MTDWFFLILIIASINGHDVEIKAKVTVPTREDCIAVRQRVQKYFGEMEVGPCVTLRG